MLLIIRLSNEHIINRLLLLDTEIVSYKEDELYN